MFNIRAKILYPVRAAVCLFFLLLSVASYTQSTYVLHATVADKTANFLKDSIGVPENFSSRDECIVYVTRLPSLLHSKGYVTASIDSLRFDSTGATALIYVGDRYSWSFINTSSIDRNLLNAAGWDLMNPEGKPMQYDQIRILQMRMLDWLENNGYPFAKVYLDSIQMNGGNVVADLKVDKGPLYRIDSIRIYGDAKVSNTFMQRYLDITDGSYYSKKKLSDITRKIRELGYVEEQKASDLTLLGTGSVLNLYLRPRRSSQINLLIGFLPNNDQLSSKRLLITGEANLLLRNALGAGETIGLNWQQLQVRSQRLNIFYAHPFIFNSPIGIDLGIDMLKKDSSYLNLNLQLGARYSLSSRQSARVFLHRYQAILSTGGVNAARVILTKRLPDVADVSTTNIGIEHQLDNTNYRLNPRSGVETRLSVTAGKKKVKKNNEIVGLQDPSDPSFDFETLYDTINLNSYQFRLSGSAAKYFAVGKQSTVRSAINGGLLLSDNVFRNELFQIGGYKLLRGFDEESQYLSQYVIGTIEYRYLININSYFFGFVDGGWGGKSGKSGYDHTYIGTGLGLTLETRSSLFTIAWAIGQRDDVPFNLRQSKIHLGFVNFF